MSQAPAKQRAAIRQKLVALLLAHGFVKVTYDHSEGDFYLKSMRLGDMPYMKEHACNGFDGLSEDSKAEIEVMPGEDIQLYVSDEDYREEPLPLSGEGIGVLVDAGVPRADIEAALA